MSKNVKTILASIYLVITIISSISCGKTSSSSGEDKVKAEIIGEENTINKNANKYSKELASFFPKEDMGEMHYSGSLEYGEVLKIYNVTGREESLVITLKGNIKKVAEQSEEANAAKLQFQKEYIIDYDSVKEIQTNGQNKKNEGSIEKSTILKLPIEKGNYWEEDAELKGKVYKAKTTILDISEDTSGKKVVKTETVIKGMEEYPDETYKEIKVFKEGKGLIEFQNILILGDKSSFDFSYRMFEIDTK